MLTGFQAKQTLKSLRSSFDIHSVQHAHSISPEKQAERSQKQSLLAQNSMQRRNMYLESVAQTPSFVETYMHGAVTQKHPSQVRYREREMANEQHDGDGMYVRTFETTKSRANRVESEFQDRHLKRSLFNDKDEPGKKFMDFVRKRDNLEEIHSHGRVRYCQFNNESDRVKKQINRSPINLEPLNT